MELIIDNKKKISKFISIFDLLRNSATTINIKFYNNYLHIQGMDKSHIILYNLILNEKWFTSYKNITECSISFDIMNFYSIITTKNNEQLLNISYNNDDILNIKFYNNDKIEKINDFNKFFKMPLLDYDYEEMKINNDTAYKVEFNIESSKIYNLFNQLNNFSSIINININDSVIDFKSEGNQGEMLVNVELDDLENYSITLEDDELNEEFKLNVSYNLDVLNKMCISIKLCETIDFYLSKELPMKISYNLGDDSSLLFFCAPTLD